MQLRKEIEDLTAKLGQQQTAAQDSKDNIKQETIKEEEHTSTDPSSQIKEEPNTAPVVKKEGEEEVLYLITFLVLMMSFSLWIAIPRGGRRRQR